MVKVKLFGLLRLDTGLKELELEGYIIRRQLRGKLCQARHCSHPEGYGWLHSNDKRRTGQKEQQARPQR